MEEVKLVAFSEIMREARSWWLSRGVPIAILDYDTPSFRVYSRDNVRENVLSWNGEFWTCDGEKIQSFEDLNYV